MNRQLDRTEIYVSPVILGAWALGGWMWGGTDETAAVSAIEAALDHGINTIDTAPVYGMGLSETLIAKAIHGKRDKVILATKCGMRWDAHTGSDPWEQKDSHGRSITIRKNLSPSSIIKECEDSLRRLNTDYIDLYQIHWPDSSTPIEESWETMASLKQQGKVRAIGVSNYNLEQLKKIHAIHPVNSIQPPYSLIRRDIEKDLLPFCKEQQIGVIVYSPLERGLLTGKISAKHIFPPNDHRSEHPLFSSQNRPVIQSLLNHLQPIANKHHATLSQLVINATFHIPGITAAIVGARNPFQATENARAMTLPLTDAERKFIKETLAQFSMQVAK